MQPRGFRLRARSRRWSDSTAWMLSTGGNISDGTATPLEWSVWTAEKPADDIRDLGEHRMTSSPANPHELTGAQAPPPSRRRGCLRYIAIDCIPDFAPPTTELSAGETSFSALKCGAKFVGAATSSSLYPWFSNLIESYPILLEFSVNFLLYHFFSLEILVKEVFNFKTLKCFILIPSF